MAKVLPRTSLQPRQPGGSVFWRKAERTCRSPGEFQSEAPSPAEGANALAGAEQHGNTCPFAST